MIYFLYDGSFDGLLTAIYEAFYSPIPPTQIVTHDNFIPNLFSEERHITTDLEKSEKVYKAIKEKISSTALKNIYHAYLSELTQIEIWIYQYLKLGFKLGVRIDNRVSDEIVMKIHHAERKVSFENHRLKGLLRFQLLKNQVYYAPIEPDHNILSLLAPHFARRMADQNWLIHDLKRGLAAVYSLESSNTQKWSLFSLDKSLQIQFAEDEELFQDLWKTFFKTVSIEERTNLKLQKQHMPVRYWKYMVEKN